MKKKKKKKKKINVQQIGGSVAIRDEQVKLEDVEQYVNENHTQIHNHGGITINQQEEQQAQSSGEAVQNGGSSNQAGVASSKASASINIVYYHDSITKKKQKKDWAIESAREIDHHSCSEDFVMARESMNFGKTKDHH